MLHLKKVERPRELTWYQAAAMLYGDWGTSKAYVLGIAFSLAGRSSWFILLLMSALTATVGLCYMTICRVYPDGGGVYSAVRERSRMLAVVGALLLVADYVVTASLSALDAFHYLHLPYPEIWAISAILFIALLNWFGPSKSGQAATLVAILAAGCVLVLFCFAAPHLGAMRLEKPTGGLVHTWQSFVGIVLALSGVEAVANMTGIMKTPVERTAKRAIWPVLIEVAVFTFLLGLVMHAVPGLSGHTEDMLSALGEHFVGRWFSVVISIVFGLLLISAVNTAIGDLVSIQFLMSKDGELPGVFSKLNRFGMPWIALLVSCAVPAAILLFEHDLVKLAALYAIGVVGAITLNLGSCSTNPAIPLKRIERIMLFVVAAILFFVEITIAFQKHQALLFAGSIVGIGLLLRAGSKMLVPVRSVYATNIEVLTVSEAMEIAPLYRSSSMVALRSPNETLLQEAILRTRALGEQAIYVQTIEEAPVGAGVTEIEPSENSLKLLDWASKEIARHGLHPIPLWQMGEHAGTLLAKAASDLEIVMMMIGTSRRSNMVRLLRGDVFKTLAGRLPKACHLSIIS